MPYDPKCEELARHFLCDAKPNATAAEVAELAQEIQTAIEYWLLMN